MSAFERSSRRKLFYSMVVLFFILAPLVLLYSRGYTVDFRNRGLTPTGGIFVKVAQPGVKIFIDEVLSRETSFIARGALLSGLLPRRYVIHVEKDGRQTWGKAAQVVDTEVLEFRDVFLPPATVTPLTIFNARRMPATVRILPSRPEIAVSAGTPGAETLFIVNPETRVARVNSTRIASWYWDRARQTILIQREVGGTITWHRLSPAGIGAEETLTFRGLPGGFGPELVALHPTASQEFYFLAGGALFLQGPPSVPLPIAEAVRTFSVTQDHLYYLTSTGFFVETNLSGGDARSLGRPGLFVDDQQSVRIIPSPNGDVLVLDSAGGLFLYQPNVDQELTPIVGNVLSVDFSEDGNRALLVQDRRLLILWLRDHTAQPYDLAKSRRQIVATTVPIREAYFNSAGTYAFFSIGDGIRMVEIDDRGGANNYRIVSQDVGSFTVNPETLELFWIDRNLVYRAQLE